MPNTYFKFQIRMIWRRFLVHSIEIIVIVCMFTPAAVAQTAQLTGTVSDPSGSSVPNAKVTATNFDTGVARASVRNEAGSYLITALLPGRYRIAAEAPGFKAMQRDTVTLAVDQIARIDFTMEVGQTQEIVNVQSTAVILETENSTVGNVVENRKITEIPLNARNPLDLLALSTGIRIQGGFGGKNGSLGNFSANGGLANANSVMVEGLALDLAQMNSPSFVPPVDSTQEFAFRQTASRQSMAELQEP